MQKLLISGVCFYFALCLLMYIFQKNLMFFPDKTPFDQCADLKSLGGTIHQSADNKTRLYHIPSRTIPKGWVLHFHGNGGRACDRIGLMTPFLDLGYHVVLAEYPGYSEAGSVPAINDLLVNAKESYSYIEKENSQNLPVILYGESVGTGPATYIATLNPKNLSSMILQTPYPSLGDVGQSHYFYLPVKLLIKDDFKAHEWAKAVNVPVFVFHGDEDEVIPFKLGKQQAENFKDVTFYAVKGSHHNDLFYLSGAEIWTEIQKFLSKR